MGWIKKARIFEPDRNLTWSRSHAQVPTALLLKNGLIRIFYSGRDQNNKSHISYLDVEGANPSKLVYLHKSPVLTLGNAGTFDDSGMMPSSVVDLGNGVVYLYYTGWNVGFTTPYKNAIGLMISIDHGMTFRKVGQGPVLTDNLHEPYFIGTAFVLRCGKVWKCWYSSCTGWHHSGRSMEPSYHIKYCESDDGIDWRRTGEIALDYKSSDEGGIVKAAVLNSSLYEMWFAYRGRADYRTNIKNSYRIGYAHSPDGRKWVRNDEQYGLGVSKDGWDSEMVAYPSIVCVEGARYMFYNGNGFGKTGFGYCEWSE